MTNRYTIYAKWPEFKEIEEIDVDAPDAEEALRLAKAELDENYQPGYEVIACNRREGLYF